MSEQCHVIGCDHPASGSGRRLCWDHGEEYRDEFRYHCGDDWDAFVDSKLRVQMAGWG